MNFIDQNNILTLYPEGRIDSSNADSVEAEITRLREANPHTAFVLDVEKLEYLSSAGLRIVLKLIRGEKDFSIVNASSDVYDIFSMTGFTEMTTVKKAYRRLSVEGCDIIGKGANGAVYRIDADTIVKVYLRPDSLSDIEKERELAKKAFIFGVPTAISYDIVRVGEGYGSVFELLDAKNLANCIDSDPEHIEDYVRMSVDLLKTIHKTTVKATDMPNMKDTVLNWANFTADYLPEAEGKKLVALVNAVPEDLHMIHGDYHVKNIMLQKGEPLLIDMDTLCYGNPVFEFGSIFNAYKGFYIVSDAPMHDFLGITEEAGAIVWKKTLEYYFGTTDEKVLQDIENKSAIIGYTRLLRRTVRRKEDGLREKKITAYREKLIALLQKTDTLELS